MSRAPAAPGAPAGVAQVESKRDASPGAPAGPSGASSRPPRGCAGRPCGVVPASSRAPVTADASRAPVTAAAPGASSRAPVAAPGAPAGAPSSSRAPVTAAASRAPVTAAAPGASFRAPVAAPGAPAGSPSHLLAPRRGYAGCPAGVALRRRTGRHVGFWSPSWGCPPESPTRAAPPGAPLETAPLSEAPLGLPLGGPYQGCSARRPSGAAPSVTVLRRALLLRLVPLRGSPYFVARLGCAWCPCGVALRRPLGWGCPGERPPAGAATRAPARAAAAGAPWLGLPCSAPLRGLRVASLLGLPCSAPLRGLRLASLLGCLCAIAPSGTWSGKGQTSSVPQEPAVLPSRTLLGCSFWLGHPPHLGRQQLASLAESAH